MINLIFSFFRFLLHGNSKKNEDKSLWNSTLGEFIATFSVLEKAGLTLKMLKQLREKDGYKIAKKIVALFNVSDEEIKVNWHMFYQKYFDIDIDLSNVKIPIPKLGFTRCLIIIPGITLNNVIVKMREQFKVYTYYDDLDKAVVKNDREAKDEPYAIWVRDGLEPEKEYINMSADDLSKKNICGEILLERLIHGLEYWDKAKKYLDYKGITLCSGSRRSDGSVPNVCFSPNDDQVNINWCGTDISLDHLGAREVSC
jgi:hypothetical protein